MPAVFNKLGIRFTYPENWKLDESAAVGGECSVTVYSPGGSFWAVSLHDIETEPRDLVRTAVKALRETYPESDVEELTETVRGRELVGADVNFYYLDLTNTALVRAFAAHRFNCLVLCEADDREFEEIEQVFRAMTATLVAACAEERESGRGEEGETDG